MSVVSVRPRDFILALFIRDDGERFLLGDNGYDFKDSQLHFSGNSIENDEVQKQGADGVMIAGQVRRASVQSFDGFVGDATDLKETIEEMRRDFIAFFAKGHHFRVIYVDTSRNAWQRKGGYLVDAPEVKELYQMHPEYHVGLNFEDVNYYSYDEDADGNEILANLVDIPVSTEASGGLVWDEDGAVSDDATVTYDTATAVATPAKNVNITDAAVAPLASFRLDGETSQNGTPTPDAPIPVQTVTGENVVKICGKNLFDKTTATQYRYISDSNGSIATSSNNYTYAGEAYIPCEPNTSYTLSGGSQYMRIAEYTSGKIFIKIVNSQTSSSPITITTSNTGAFLRVSYNDTSLGDADIQLELGSTATAYEAYKSQSYEVNFNLEHGKNMLDPSTLVDGYISVNGEYNIAHSYDEMRGGMIAVEPNTAYTFSIQATRGGYDPWFGVGEYTSDNVTSFVRRDTNSAAGATSITFTTSATTNYIAVSARNLKTATKVQLEQGGSATTYEPWSPLELCKIGDYQDYIYPSGGKWYVRKEIGKYVYNNDLGTNGISATRVDMLTPALPIAPNTSTQNIAVSNMYGSTITDNTGLGGTTASSLIRIITSASIAGSYDAVKALAAANNLTIYYALATPTDTEITNEALIAQLETLLTTARTYAGTNNIFTITPNEQGTLEISYYTKYQPRVTAGGYVWEAGGSGGATTVVNNSIGNVNPIWKVYGPTNNPTLENTTTGEQIEYVGLVADGQTLTIDMGAQTASLDGLNVISNVVGDYISLAPGANKLVYSVTGEAGASELGWSEIVG